ncbi:MAG: glycosyltransferase family 9 protein [Candidatus Aenigmarchaeota archaeon]|nr:glycosyltransferase family 9 protein [Candidatus Aenigmarchaeota archaeon]
MSVVQLIGKALFTFKKKELPKKIDKILFFKIGALGDVLMTTPLVRAIRQRFPHATIYYACGNSFEHALRGNKNINYLIPFDERIFLNSGFLELKKLATRLRENKYDIIFVLDKHWAAGLFAARCGRFRTGFDRNGEGFANNLNVYYRQNKHDIDAYLDLGIYFKAKLLGREMDLAITKQDRKFAKKICKKPSIAVAPGGAINTGQRAKIKIWPKENYLRVIDALCKKFSIVVVGGKEDKRICSWIYKHAKNKKKIQNLCGKTTISQTGAIMELCKFVVCNDSGAMHIASCVNNNVISLFGPTNPYVLAPLNKGSVFIWKEKQACYDIYGRFNTCDKNLMKKITVEDVLYAAKRYQ